MLLGKKVYYISFKDRCIKEGYCIGYSISSAGYALVGIKINDREETHVEEALVSEDKVALDELFNKVLPISDKMNAMVKEHLAQLNVLRKKIVGDAQFKHLIEKE